MAEPPLPDFSDDAEVAKWFAANVWSRPPLPSNSDALTRLEDETFALHAELTRRMGTVGHTPLSRGLVVSGAVVALTGVALLFFPPVGFAAAVGATTTLAGGGLFIAGNANESINNEARDQLTLRLEELLRLQREIAVRKRG
jgi:hypothetical protein